MNTIPVMTQSLRYPTVTMLDSASKKRGRRNALVPLTSFSSIMQAPRSKFASEVQSLRHLKVVVVHPMCC